MNSLEELGVKTPTTQLGTGTLQELLRCWGTGTVLCSRVFRAAEAATSVPSLGVGFGEKRGRMQPWIRFLEVGGTYVFVAAVCSVPRLPIRALPGDETHPDRDCVYGIELFWLGLVWVFLLLHPGAWLNPKFQLSTCRWSL